MLQVKNLTITHRADDRELLNNFSMVLGDGDKAALIGEEGNGKSTLLKLLYDETLVDNYVEYSGEIIRNGARIGYLAQELAPENRGLSIYEFCAESTAFYDLTPKELSGIAARLMLPADFFYGERLVEQLSGGEKVKLQLARILMEQPDMLFLDEPSNDIDLDTLAWLENFIQETKTPVLYISHDETLLERTANKIIHIEQIRRKTKSRYTVAAVGYAEYVSRRESGLIRQEQAARKERDEYQKQQERFRQIQQKVEHQQNAISRQDPHGGRLLKKKMHAVKSLERRFEKEYENMTELPETEDAIYIRFGEKNVRPNGKRVLDFALPELRAGERLLAKNIRLSVIGPEHICIVGKNGMGKTTLLREIAGNLQKRSDIHVFYMPQNYEDALPMERTPVEYLSKSGDKEEISRIRTYLGSMKYTADEMGHAIGELSGGQKAKLLLLKMSMEGCDVLLLDEPTRNFSPLSNPVIRSMLKGFRGAIISVSHDRKYIGEVAETVYELTANGLYKVEREQA
ncbi:MAG: ABC-F family ATP-binding cassette domain-containing protein [Roseburia sp.]|nr:ABC-F family ATP-binding cassette domain-containing protein [Roseburia sp.]